jgi:hypothetical protein
MLQTISDLPGHVVGITASGNVTKEDYENVLVPAIDLLAKRTKELNFLLVLETPVKNFTLGAWWEDAKLGLKHFTQWNKVAIVTAEKGVEKFSDMFGKVVPGEFKGFATHELETAKAWVAAPNTIAQ